MLSSSKSANILIRHEKGHTHKMRYTKSNRVEKFSNISPMSNWYATICATKKRQPKKNPCLENFIFPPYCISHNSFRSLDYPNVCLNSHVAETTAKLAAIPSALDCLTKLDTYRIINFAASVKACFE